MNTLSQKCTKTATALRFSIYFLPTHLWRAYLIACDPTPGKKSSVDLPPPFNKIKKLKWVRKHCFLSQKSAFRAKIWKCWCYGVKFFVGGEGGKNLMNCRLSRRGPFWLKDATIAGIKFEIFS